jgi:hypothetical protein
MDVRRLVQLLVATILSLSTLFLLWNDLQKIRLHQRKAVCNLLRRSLL